MGCWAYKKHKLFNQMLLLGPHDNRKEEIPPLSLYMNKEITLEASSSSLLGADADGLAPAQRTLLLDNVWNETSWKSTTWARKRQGPNTPLLCFKLAICFP